MQAHSNYEITPLNSLFIILLYFKRSHVSKNVLDLGKLHGKGVLELKCNTEKASLSTLTKPDSLIYVWKTIDK